MKEVLLLMKMFCVDFAVQDCGYNAALVDPSEMPVVLTDSKYPTGRRAHGYCLSNKREILLNSEHWSYINSWEKKELIYHELGHCIFNLSHNDGYSIMNSTNPQSDYHVKPDGSNWDYLVKELLNRVKERNSNVE